ncbi:MAG: hypothetical protein MR779_00325 [Tenericutes bacterium]|nr:hypothetical protein [Mycoplasmatota bacterium]
MNTNIENLDISEFSYEQLDSLFYHWSPKEFFSVYNETGMPASIGKNSDGIDSEVSIFFSKGTLGVLLLWDVWLKWRLNRMFNPQYRGNNLLEVRNNQNRYFSGNITEEERREWVEWIRYFCNKEFMNDPKVLETLFKFEFNEMMSSDYFVLDLKENEEFRWDQIDSKKQSMLLNEKKYNRISTIGRVQYGSYSDYSTPVADKWNMQTIPGKNIIIEPKRMKKLTFKGRDDVFSVISAFYDMYKRSVSAEEQVSFDVLDKYILYIRNNYVKMGEMDLEGTSYKV